MSRRQLPDHHGNQVRAIDLVAPLSHKDTAMRITENAGHPLVPGRSGAVSPLIGARNTGGLRRGDVDSAIPRSTSRTPTMPTARTSTMATRTTTTSRTSISFAPSADQPARGHADFYFPREQLTLTSSVTDHGGKPPFITTCRNPQRRTATPKSGPASAHALNGHCKETGWACNPTPPTEPVSADFSFDELIVAYTDCRRTKRNTPSAQAFEQDQERNLVRLYDELRDGSYRPGRTTCFVIMRPKPREVWAADYRDRIVHHLLYNRIAARFERAFIADSCACIPGRGTLYAARRLEAKVRSITQNWSRPAWYLKLDLANFFVSIDKRILRDLLARRVTEPWWLWLTETILFHDPREGAVLHSPPERMALIPPYKSLFNQPAHQGLPIGNLSSQFFANVYLDALDQHVKHRLRARHYIRYVDDFVLLHESPQWLNAVRAEIETFLPETLGMRLNPTKTILQPIERGIDFVGQVTKPWHRTLRRRTFNEALRRVRETDTGNLFETANSYFGLLRQATHSRTDRIRLARLVRRRGFTVNGAMTKTFKKSA